MPGKTASSWMPALLTMICTAPPSSIFAHGLRHRASSVMSKTTTSALPPAAA
jgi:hypothetical protein